MSLKTYQPKAKVTCLWPAGRYCIQPCTQQCIIFISFSFPLCLILEISTTLYWQSCFDECPHLIKNASPMNTVLWPSIFPSDSSPVKPPNVSGSRKSPRVMNNSILYSKTLMNFKFDMAAVMRACDSALQATAKWGHALNIWICALVQWKFPFTTACANQLCLLAERSQSCTMHNKQATQDWGLLPVRLNKKILSQSCREHLFFGAHLIQQNSSF